MRVAVQAGIAPEPFPFGLPGAWPAFLEPPPRKRPSTRSHGPAGAASAVEDWPPPPPNPDKWEGLSRVGASVGSQGLPLCTPNLRSLPKGLTPRVHPSNLRHNWLPGNPVTTGAFWLVSSQGCIIFLCYHFCRDGRYSLNKEQIPSAKPKRWIP